MQADTNRLLLERNAVLDGVNAQIESAKAQYEKEAGDIALMHRKLAASATK